MRFFVAFVSITCALSCYAEVSIGKTAALFELKAATGKTVKLKELRGKTVVLEWLNHGCPFVKKHYKSGNMQELQKKYTGLGVVWLSIISSAKGKQGYSSPDKALQDKEAKESNASHILLDTKGEVGRTYGAKVTPHMFIIDKRGELVYQGGIDSIASADVADVKKAKPYVALALDSLAAGKKVKIKESQPYGCSVKY